MSSFKEIEIAYSDLVESPMEIIQNIYKDLLKDDFSCIDNSLSEYLQNQSHKIKNYQYEAEFIHKVNQAKRI